MRLINITTRYYIVLFLAVLSLWSVVFYFIMRHEIYRSSNEILFNRAQNIIKHVINSPSDVKSYPMSNFQFTEIPASIFKSIPTEVYTDTLIYEATDDEYDEYRKLITKFQVANAQYKLTVLEPRLESTEIFNTISETLIPFSILMIIALTISARLLNEKLWQPFYKILNFLSNYRVDKEVELKNESLKVDEFHRLQESINNLVTVNNNVFLQQKQFIENASHETQTPLAVIQSQLEILLQSPELSDEQSRLIQSALKETDRLSKLNKTLLLLSKIENAQFLERSPVHLYKLVERLLQYFEDKKGKMQLEVDVVYDEIVILETNAILFEVLIGNLLKNAFSHNVKGGKIIIQFKKRFFSIRNNGKLVPDADRVFERFYTKGSGEGWGLGLAIVKKIVELNGWKVEYSFQDGMHSFQVNFSESSVFNQD
jgi:signal transduction histidine kinase